MNAKCRSADVLPYRVDRWFIWSSGRLRVERADCSTPADALKKFEQFAAAESTTRVRMIRRGSPGSIGTVLRVWVRAAA